MAASNEGLIDNINCKLTTGGLTDIQASQLAGAAQALSCSSFYSVASEASLPSAALNKGRFVYVQSLCRYRYSNGTSWTNCYSSIAQNYFTAWGCNINGRFGDNTTTNQSIPTQIGTDINWTCVSTFYRHSAGIKTDGTLWTWGYNVFGQLGANSTSTRSSPGTVVGGGVAWCAISVGDFFTAGIRTDGTLWTWGQNVEGRLADGTTTNRSSPGTTAGGGTNWCFINSSTRHSVAIKTDGTLWTWGNNVDGALGDGTATARSSPVTTAGGGTNWCVAGAAVCNTTAAVKTDGTLWTWGRNSTGQLGDGTTTSRSSPGTTAGGGTNWCAVSAGGYHIAAIKTDGTLWTWGSNGSGQLGDGTVTSRTSPVTTAGGGTNWCAVSAGCNTTAAVKTDGTLWTWGSNSGGTLGIGSGSARSSPGTTCGTAIYWKKICNSFLATLAIRYDRGV
jgi:alpha-tubulin suppressor-like RCC1 family protein